MELLLQPALASDVQHVTRYRWLRQARCEGSRRCPRPPLERAVLRAGALLQAEHRCAPAVRTVPSPWSPQLQAPDSQA